MSFAKIFGIRKLQSWAIVWHCLRDPMFSRFRKTLICDGQTDKWTDTWQQLINAPDSVAWVKILITNSPQYPWQLSWSSWPFLGLFFQTDRWQYDQFSPHQSRYQRTPSTAHDTMTVYSNWYWNSETHYKSGNSIFIQNRQQNIKYSNE